MSVRVGDIERAVAREFPTEWAEDWDRVGLLAGDPEREVTGVVLALDPTRAAIAACVERGANVLVTHHPAFLKPPQWLTPGRGAAGVVFSAMDAGVALVNAHTNLDRAPAAGTLLPERLGLTAKRPVERSAMPMSLVTVFVPAESAARVADAMAGAGAGRIGDYEGCRFTSPEGVGAFTPRAGAHPVVGGGSPTETGEVRLEMVSPRTRVRGVIGAARGAHPYEEPLVVAADVEIARSAARMGMLCDAGGVRLRDLVERAATEFGTNPRVWGDPEARVDLAVTATGSAGSLVGDALSTGATALVAGEVRYHDALDAVENGLCIVELGHDVTEWPLVGLLGSAVRATPGLDATLVHELPAARGWWAT